MADKNQKLYPRKDKIIKTFIFYTLILLVLLYGLFSSRFAWAYDTQNDITSYIIQDVIVITLWLILSAISLYVLLYQNYYVILKDSIVHHRWVKDIKIKYNEILYIDEEYSKKHQTVLLYTDKGSSFFFVMDKDQEIFNLLKTRCENLMGKDEYHKKFPKISL